MHRQRTLSSKVSCVGVGLHSGKEVRLELNPAEVDSGIVFLRTDLPARPKIHANAANVTATLRATTLEEDGARVFTIEHLLSALNACRIDNCEIELNAEEPPVLNGNAIDFFNMIQAAGVVEQDKARKIIRLEKIYRVDGEEGKRFVMALPCENFRVSFVSVNPHPLIGIQYGDYEITEQIYAREIAPARTIAYEKEIDTLRKMGLGLGGTLENVIVYNDEGWRNELKYPDELVRHKILDVIGDLRLAGIFNCHIVAAASGHALNTQLAKAIYADFPK